MTLQHATTFDKTKQEIMQDKNKNNIITNQPMFHRKDFEDKDTVLILAKTWGAANLFFYQTVLCKFRKMKIEYLSKGSQIKRDMNRENTIVIQLSRALELEKNVRLLSLCKEKNLKVLKYGISTGV